jgi:hypothetical protein
VLEKAALGRPADEGGSARHVEADTRLSEYLVAAELRFPLPPSAISP